MVQLHPRPLSAAMSSRLGPGMALDRSNSMGRVWPRNRVGADAVKRGRHGRDARR